jgi:dATP pyrophosphohydrolase
LEETGLDTAHYELTDWKLENRYEIYMHWRHRYPEGVAHNTEHVFGLRLPAPVAITIAPREHLRYAWLPWEQAAERCFSWSNAEAIRQLPVRAGGAGSTAGGASR